MSVAWLYPSVVEILTGLVAASITVLEEAIQAPVRGTVVQDARDPHASACGTGLHFDPAEVLQPRNGICKVLNPNERWEDTYNNPRLIRCDYCCSHGWMVRSLVETRVESGVG